MKKPPKKTKKNSTKQNDILILIYGTYIIKKKISNANIKQVFNKSFYVMMKTQRKTVTATRIWIWLLRVLLAQW